MNEPVSFELAKLLKEKDINIYSEKCYTDFDGFIRLEEGASEIFPYAPTIADVVMWLYEKHGIWISVLQMLNNGVKVTWYASYYEQGVGEDIEVYYDSPTEAYEAVIDYTLNHLI